MGQTGRCWACPSQTVAAPSQRQGEFVTLRSGPTCTTVNRMDLQGRQPGREGGQAAFPPTQPRSHDAMTLQAGEGEAYVGLAPAWPI